uniref:Uncharacterized protein n=1 Tax=Arundo donax TaxID=35708 RepID=A0A0A9HJW5_ARUDO
MLHCTGFSPFAESISARRRNNSSMLFALLKYQVSNCQSFACICASCSSVTSISWCSPTASARRAANWCLQQSCSPRQTMS